MLSLCGPRLSPPVIPHIHSGSQEVSSLERSAGGNCRETDRKQAEGEASRVSAALENVGEEWTAGGEQTVAADQRSGEGGGVVYLGARNCSLTIVIRMSRLPRKPSDRGTTDTGSPGARPRNWLVDLSMVHLCCVRAVREWAHLDWAWLLP